VQQIESPVRWVETIEKMAASGIDTLVECGPGKVLSGLNRRIVRDMQTLPVLDPASLQEALAKTSGE
jgi:[acyl-carrier-protein] S-malonyltransferase